MQWTAGRKRFAQEVAEDAIVTALNELHFADILTTEEVQYFYTSLGKTTGLLGLLPRKLNPQLSPKELKAQIRKRVRGPYQPRSCLMYSSCIVHRKKGESIPADWKARLLASCRAMGGAVLKPETGTMDVYQFTGTKEILEESLNDLDGLTDFDVVLTFQQFPGDELHPDDAEPHTIAEVNVKNAAGEQVKEPSVVAFYDGGFIGHHHPDSIHSNAFHFHNSFVKETVNSVGEGDLGTLYEKLNTTLMKNVLKQGCVPRGVILIATGKGDKVVVQNGNDESEEYTWGWASRDPFKWDSEHKNVEPKHVHPPGGTPLSQAELMKQRIAARKAGGVVKDDTAVKEAVSNKTDTSMVKVDIEPLERLCETDGFPPTKAQMMRVTDKTLICPDPGKSNEKKKSFLRYHFGKNTPLPGNLNNGIPYGRILPSSQYKLVKESKDETAMGAAIQAAKVKGDEPPLPASQVLKPTAPSVPSVPPGASKAVVTGALLLISPDLKKKMMEDVIPKLTLRDPRDFEQEALAEVPTVCEQLGMKMEDLLLLDDQSILEFCRAGNGAAAAALIAEQFRDFLIKYDKEFLTIMISEVKEQEAKDAAPVVPEKKLSAAEAYKARIAARKSA